MKIVDMEAPLLDALGIGRGEVFLENDEREVSVFVFFCSERVC